MSVFIDLCSRWIAGWALSTRLTDDLILKALDRALESRDPAPGLMHHSDGGSQYTSEDYLEKLETRGFVVSMSRKGKCWDNAPMESFFASLKAELDDRSSLDLAPGTKSSNSSRSIRIEIGCTRLSTTRAQARLKRR